MKKIISLFALISLMQAGTAFALSSSTTPSVDSPASPVNSAKIYITGTSTAGAKITVTGGSYEIAPIYADSKGKFSILVSLQQEKTNTYHVKSQESGKDFSKTVDVTIVESDSKAADYEALTGSDRTAPTPPTLDKSTASTTSTYYYITGSGEAKASVIVSGSSKASGSVDSAGKFKVKVGLKGKGGAETFNVSLKDAAGNVSSASKIVITGTSTASLVLSEDGSASGESEMDRDDFSDVYGHWAESYIKKLHALGIISGYADGRFGPDDYVSRAQLLKMALLAFSHDITQHGGEVDFTDIMTDSWYLDYITYAKTKGIVAGYSDGSFKPDKYVNRAEALKIIFVAADIVLDDTEKDEAFSDITADDWYIKYCKYAKKHGIIGGYTDGSFRGWQNITRAEVAKILSIMIE